MPVNFLYPQLGFLLLLVILLWFVPARPRSLVHGLIRSLLFVCLIIALMQPSLITHNLAQHHVVIVDQSPSIAPAIGEQAYAAAKNLQKKFGVDDKTTLIKIASQADLPLADETELDERYIRLGGQDNNESPLDLALTVAAQSIPLGVDGSVTLISDGLSTGNNWTKVIQQLVASNIPVHTVQLESKPYEPYLSALTIDSGRAGEMLAVQFKVIGQADNLVVALHSDNQLLTQSEPFGVDGHQEMVLEIEAGDVDFMDVSASLLDVTDAKNSLLLSSVTDLVSIREPLNVLYLGQRQVGGGNALENLLSAGFNVTSLNNGEIDSSIDFTPYDVVLLDDIPQSSLSLAVQNKLIEAVQNDGVGLLHSGRRSAFGLGGYADSALAQIFPVDIKGQAEKADPSVGVAIILDTSGSMAGTRLELAKQTAIAIVRRLKPHDRVGIVEFYGAKHWAVPLQSAANKIEINRAIGRTQAIGGTVLYPAVQEAYFGLQGINTRYKHIIVITDAGIEDANFERMIRNIAKDNISLSSILVGARGHNEIMAEMAKWGKGRFYTVSDQFSLVDLILKQPSTKKKPNIRDGQFSLLPLNGQSWWGDINLEGIPDVNGYVKLNQRLGSEVVLQTAASQEPVLVSWHYGLGRVTMLGLEPFGDTTASWQSWADYGRFLGRILSRTAMKSEPFFLNSKRTNNAMTVSVKVIDDTDNITPVLYLVDERGQKNDKPIGLSPVAPGLFQAKFHFPQDQAFRAFVAHPVTGQIQRLADIAFSDVSPEMAGDDRNQLNFAALSQMTGGKSLSNLDFGELPLNSSSDGSSYSVKETYHWFLLAALIIFILELIYRRMPVKGRFGRNP